jgi:pantoate--beta-alanine ligase
MEILRTVGELRAWSRGERKKGYTVGLVPTMGALHAGHASLIEAAAGSCQRVAVSIFVNPTQFGPNEDFAQYPRSWDADCRLAEAAGAHVIFAPSVEEMYPDSIRGSLESGAGFGVGTFGTFVEVSALSDRLDGKSRPGHFRGVATVVAKLLIACEADQAFFGQKDAAQVAVLRRMVADLRIGTEIVVCPIVREPDGLALSSRNVYLSADQRKQALVLSRAVRHMEWLIRTGERRSEALIAGARAVFAGEPEVRVDYIEVVDWGTLEPVAAAWKGTLIAVAAWVGATRLIDNAVIG